MGDLYANLKYSRPPEISDKILLSHTLVHETSFQCLKYLELEIPLQVMSCKNGWYLGAEDEEGTEIRDSEYFSTEQEAREARANHSWTQRLEP